MSADNVARLPGVVAVADSQHRDRWGVDGWHPEYICDGKTDGPEWVSDNWEVTHTVALVFPRAVEVSGVKVTWAKWGDVVMTPKRFVVEGLSGGRWVKLAEVRGKPGEAATVVDLAGGNAAGAAAPRDRTGGTPVPPASREALRIVQPPEGAPEGGDRRMGVVEIEVDGKAVEPAAVVDVAKVQGRVAGELRALRQSEDDARVAPALAIAMKTPKHEGFMGPVSREDLALGRKNIATRKWAKVWAEGVIKDADWWVAQSDEYIRGLIPEGNPRALCPSFELGCPIHGGARGTFTATLEKPYCWKCSKGGELWYDGAVVKNPKTGEDVTVVDKGDGWLAPEGFLHPGKRYYFTAAYRYYLIGKLFSSPYEGDGGSKYQGGTPVMQLACAYAATGDPKYAHKCLVMLNRLADLYRTWDGCVEGPSQRQDGYIGQTFERFLVQNVLLACDLVWDEAVNGTSPLGPLSTSGEGKTATVAENLQRNLLGYIYEYLHRLMPYFDGDFVMYEMTALALEAKVLGNADIAAEALESDVGLRVMLTNEWFRDGKFIYDSTGYNVGNAQTPLTIAEYIHGFTAPPRFPKPVDVYNAPDYHMAMLFDFLRNIDCDGRVPQIGDVGGARTKSLNVTPPYSSLDERALVRLPKEAEYYRQRLQAASGGDLEAFREGRADWWVVFHVTSPPRSPSPLHGEGGAATAPTPPAPLPRREGGVTTTARRETAESSHLFDDSGIAILRAGDEAETRQHVSLTFSKGAYGHGHPDKLAINLMRYGYDLTADLGYPTTWTDIKSGGWEKATASHCLVALDEAGQQGNVIGKLQLWDTKPGVDVVEASAEGAYSQASVYRRTVALVRDDNGEALYTADIFRVAGAKTRDYLFHALGKPEDMSVALEDTGAAWVKQAKGSLAGEDVEPMTRGGYGFLFDLQRAKTDGGLTATWAPTSGTSQPDRYLLTRQAFGDCTVEFTITRTGKASGPQERSVFVFGMDLNNMNARRVLMLPADTLPVGKAVPVRIEIVGGDAKMTVDGAPSGSVNVVGTPPTQGALGFLHYYNYAYDYADLKIMPKGGAPIAVDFSKPLDRNFWARLEPTYEAVGGVLQARDSEPLAITLRMAGEPGREVIRAKAEGYGVRGQAPLEGHLIVRDRVADPRAGTAFAAVMEATHGKPRVTGITRLTMQPVAQGDCDAVALEVRTVDAKGETRVDTILSAMDGSKPHTVQARGGTIEFRGRFGMVTERGGQVALVLSGGGKLTYGGKTVEHPASFAGRIMKADVAKMALVVQADGTGETPSAAMIGRKLLVRNPAFVCPAVYTVESVERVDGRTWRLGLNMTLVVARGVVASVDRGNGAFASRTPVMKLRVNPGLFNGKCVRKAGGDKEYRLESAEEGAFKVGQRIADWAAGDEYVVCDVGAGDQVEVM